ncbi:MAG: acyl-CoA dehydrogenase family protein [Dehalococcoidia bacterium]
MEFALTREHEMLRKMVGDFVESEVTPRAEALDEAGDFPFDLVKKSADLGLVGMINSKDNGGTQMGHLARMITIEEVSRIYPSLGFFFQTGHLAMYILEGKGTDEQKERYLPSLCRGETISCTAITEPSGGSDLSGTQTTAELDGDDYVISGRKVFTTLGGVADVACVVAKSGDGFSVLLVDKETPGFEIPHREPRSGLRSLPVNELSFTNCRVPRTNLIGAEGRGLGVAIGAVGAIGRTGAAGVGLGIAEGVYEIALKFAKERKLYGKPIFDLQAVQFALVDIDVEIEAAKWLCYYSAWLLDQGKTAREASTEIARAKLFTVDVANRASLKAVQLMGAYGLSPEFQVERRFNDALELFAAAGTREIMKVTIGASLAR